MNLVDAGVGFYRHWKIQHDPVARLPCAHKLNKAILYRCINRLSVHGELPTFGRFRIAVQFSGNQLVSGPGGNAKVKTEATRLLGIDLEFDLAFEGILSRLLDGRFVRSNFNLRRVSAIEQAIDGLLSSGIHILRNLGNQARDVCGAAGRAKPFRARGVPIVCLQRIGIEKAGGIESNTGKAIVEQCNFCDIHILGVAKVQEHAHVEEHVAHGGTRFEIGILVRQHVGRPEAFDPVHRPESAGNVHLGIDDIVPDCVERFPVIGSAEQAFHFGHSGILIGGTHRVPHRLGLFGNRLVLLSIGAGHYAIAFRHESDAPDIQKLFRHVEVELVAGIVVELHQPDSLLSHGKAWPDRFRSPDAPVPD